MHRYLHIRLPKILSCLLILIVLGAALPSSAEANKQRGQALKDGAKVVIGFIFGAAWADKVDDLYDATEDYVQEQLDDVYYWVADTVTSVWDSGSGSNIPGTTTCCICGDLISSIYRDDYHYYGDCY